MRSGSRAVHSKALHDCPQNRVGADEASLAVYDRRRVDACQGYDPSLFTRKKVWIDKSLGRVLARQQRYDYARGYKDKNDERCDKPLMSPDRQHCAGGNILIVRPKIRARELKTLPLVMIEFQRCVHCQSNT